MPTNVDTSGWKLPINLGLNDGTYCAQGAIDVLLQHNERHSLRNYSDGDNSELRRLIAEECGVTPQMVYLQNGSGPILKQVIPHLVRDSIKSSASRMLKHLTSKSGYPIITPSLTYFKVPLGAEKKGLSVRLVPLRPERDFKLDIGELEAAIKQGDGLVYLANPNNPTGNVLVTREQIVPLIKKYPKSTFWIDEAYVQYVDPAKHSYMPDLVGQFENVVCTRTFSFAYGMASARIGYIVAQPDLIAKLEGEVTNYRIPLLTERMGVATLKDTQHLPDVRVRSKQARDYLTERMGKWSDRLKVFPSEVNFLLVQTLDGPKAKAIAAGLLERGVKIKTFVPLQDYRYDEFFRITIGLPEENEFLADMLDEVMEVL
ncbi:MAG: histidinol-phosphate transaminase [Myxococcota bacterium]|nr:histidinol-phosphate transaminase [Myxococcota bacterium]